MGAWGTGAFENDGAADWVAELEAQGEGALRSALRRVAEAADDAYVEAPEAELAVAAAEVVAALHGHRCEDLPEEVCAWIDGHGVPGDDLLDLALRAVKRVHAASELRELWDEAGDDAWAASIADLRFRLGDASAP